MDFDTILSDLQNNKLIRTHEEAQAFDRALALLPKDLTLDQIQALFLVFDDDCVHFEVMWGLVHVVEHYSGEQLSVRIWQLCRT